MFPEILSHVITRLEQTRKNGLLQAYALIGGFAVSAWGVSRATQDIDLAVALGTSAPLALATHLGATYEAGRKTKVSATVLSFTHGGWIDCEIRSPSWTAHWRDVLISVGFPFRLAIQ